MKAVIIYYSKTGFTRRYAQWLAEDLNCPAVPYQRRGSVALGDYDTVILMGSLWAGRLLGLDWLKKRLPALTGKRLAALAVGAAPMDDPELPGNMASLFGPVPQVTGFYAQGGINYEHMGAVDRAMMAMLRAALQKQPDMADRLAYLSRSFAAADRNYRAPLAAWARGTTGE